VIERERERAPIQGRFGIPQLVGIPGEEDKEVEGQ